MTKISIIMPIKNGENYMREAVAGIKKQNMDVEIIVVDDGSTDNTSALAASLGCEVIKNETSQGPVIAKNKALNVAQGQYIMFHDHDDIMNEGVLTQLYQKLEENPDISAVMAKVKDFFSPEVSEDERAKTAIKTEPYWGLFTGAILIRKTVFDTIGLFSENVTAGEIIDWQTKMTKHNLTIKKIDLVSTNRRIHTSNFGKTQAQTEYKDYAKALRERLAKGVK